MHQKPPALTEEAWTMKHSDFKQLGKHAMSLKAGVTQLI